jgi:hypothetical protein
VIPLYLKMKEKNLNTRILKMEPYGSMRNHEVYVWGELPFLKIMSIYFQWVYFTAFPLELLSFLFLFSYKCISDGTLFFEKQSGCCLGYSIMKSFFMYFWLVDAVKSSSMASE